MSSRKESSPVRVRRNQASTLPWGCSTKLQALAPATPAAPSWLTWPCKYVSASGPSAVTTSRSRRTAPVSATLGLLAGFGHPAGGGDGHQHRSGLGMALGVLG